MKHFTKSVIWSEHTQRYCRYLKSDNKWHSFYFLLLNLCLILQSCTDCFTFATLSTCTLVTFDFSFKTLNLSGKRHLFCLPVATLTKFFDGLRLCWQTCTSWSAEWASCLLSRLLFSNPAVCLVKSRGEIFCLWVYIYIYVHVPFGS